MALNRRYTNANKQQNKYKFKHWILVLDVVGPIIQQCYADKLSYS